MEEEEKAILGPVRDNFMLATASFSQGMIYDIQNNGTELMVFRLKEETYQFYFIF